MIRSIATTVLLLPGALHAQDTPPQPTPEQLFEQKLARHPYFANVALHRVDTHAPYLFLVQRIVDEDGTRAASLAERYVALLDPTLELFEREVAQPLGLVQRPDHSRFVVAILASRGDMDNFQRSTQSPWHLDPNGYYDPILDAAVVYEDPFQAPRPAVDVARGARHGFLHVCQQAWYLEKAEAPFESWVMEGLAEELACRDPIATSSPTDAGSVRAFVSSLVQPERRWAEGRTLEELCTVQTARRLEGFFRTSASAERPFPEDFNRAWWAFYREGALLFHFLWEEDGGRHRTGLLAFLKQVFAGREDWGTFVASYQPAEARELERAFLTWALGVHHGTRPNDRIDPALVLGGLDRGAPADGVAPEVPVPAPGPELDLADLTFDERLGLAIDGLSHARTTAALAELEALARDTLEAGPRERAERERRRAQAWIELRDAFLRERAAGGGTLELTHRGKKAKAKVLAFADGKVELDRTRVPDPLGVDELDPLELAQQMKSGGTPGEWARLVPYVLRDDPRARKLLKEDGGEGAALLRDAREDYPARIRLGALCRRLEEIAAREVPASPGDVRAQLDELLAWTRDAAETGLRARKAPAIEARARKLLEREVELSPHGLLRGKLERLEGDRVRVLYEFEDARELEDFSAEPYPPLARKALTDPRIADVPFHVEDGALQGEGETSLRSLWELAAPLTVRYSLKFLKSTLDEPRSGVTLGVCDDGREHFVWAYNIAFLQLFDLEANAHAGDSPGRLYIGTSYAVELRHDGTRATLSCEGTEQASIDVGTRQAGALFLCTGTECPIVIERLEIEGQLRPYGLARLRQAWIERELAPFR